MRLKTFTAASMAEAMARIRETMGPDAIIVSQTRNRLGNRVTVTAAIEPDRVPPPQPAARPTNARPAPAEGQSREPVSARAIEEVLTFHRVPARLAGHLARLAGNRDSENNVTALAAAFDAMFRFAPLPSPPPRPVMLIGPTGVGKTATAAKLAVRAVIDQQAVSVATTDVVRAAAVDQLAALLGVLQIPLATAKTPDELAALLAGANETPPVQVIDSPGANPFDASEIRDLEDMIGAAEVDPVLVLAAGMDPIETSEIVEIFAAIGARRMIFTRLDAARRLGSLLAAADAGRLAFADVSQSPYVAETLEPLNPLSLARLFWTQGRRARTQPKQTVANG